ncbi:MAG: Amino acid adenylation [Myxococcales bacterium]|nr:Amino acid adenylation [Myxococcales bacterium]
MMILAHVDLVVRNLERSLAFYVERLGCSIATDTLIEGPAAGFYSTGDPATAAMRLVLLRLPSDGQAFGGMIELIELHGEPPSGPDAEAPAPPRAYGIRNFTLAVEDLSRSLAELRAKGVVPWREAVMDLTHRGQGKIAFIADPDGNWIELVEAQPHRTVGPKVADARQRQQLVTWNATARDYPREHIHEAFERQAAVAPSRTALVFEAQSLTYAELDARANQLARHLRARGIGPESLVGVAMERSVEMVVSLLAVLKAGAAYVPFDPGYPKDRLEYMIGDARPAIVLIQEELRRSLPFGDGQILAVDSAWSEIAGLPADNLGVAVRPENLAYVIYTSGSTGRPKGAMNTHAGIANRLQWMQEQYRLTADDRILQKTPFSFDVSVWELFWPLMYGARLVVAKPRGHQDPDYLVKTIVDEGITTIHFVPPMLGVFLEAEAISRCTSLRCVIASGEALPFNLVVRFRERLGAALHNLYGPTEASVDVSHWTCELDGPPVVPIGRPIANLRLHVLDASFEPVAIGVEGEIHIAGIGLARGYLDRPALTAERFVPDPFSPEPGGRLYKTGDLGRWRADGVIEYLGRNDHQVKIRGFRIELGEIEAQLALHPAIREVVVIAREDAPGDKQLVAYIVGNGLTPDVAELRAHLETELPPYMVPAAFVMLDELPLTPNGKLDRKALRAPAHDVATRSHEAPRGDVEQALARLWAELLRVDHVGRHDHFFHLGGHSLLAMRLISRVRELLGVELSLSMLAEAPTLGELAARVAASGRRGTVAGPTPRAARTGDFPVLPAQRRLWFADQMALRNFDVEAITMFGELDAEALRGALDHVTRIHPAFATTFVLEAGVLVQRIGPAVDAGLEIVDLAGEDRERARIELEDIERGEAGFPCDVEAGPLHRLVLCRLSEQEHVLFVGFHHLMMDGWSMQVFLADLENEYRAARGAASPPLVSPPVDCADVARWRATDARRPAPDLVRSVIDSLRGAPQLLTLRCARPRPSVQDYDGTSVPIDLDGVMGDVKRFAREHGVTPVALLLAAFSVLMSRETGARDMIVGVPVANRDRLELERVIGCVMDIVPIRIRVDGDETVPALVRSVHAALIRAPEVGAVSLEEILQHVSPARTPAHDPLFQVMFVNETGWERPLSLDGLRCERRRVHSAAARMDLLLSIHERPEGAGGYLEYRRSLFSDEDADRLVRAYVATVVRLCERDARIVPRS